MSAQSNSETVFSARRFEDTKTNTQTDSTPSPIPGTNSAKRNLFGEGVLNPNSGSGHDPSSSGKKANRKGSDESISDFQARKADQLQKYNCEGFVRSATKYHDHLNSEEKKKERVRKEIHNLEFLLNEIQLKHNIDQKIDNMRSKVSVLNTNFDTSVKLGRGLHEKYQYIKQLSAGAEFIKLAFKKNKLEKRFVFYSETLEAICWRDPKAKIPKTKQMIYLAEIIKVKEDFKTSKAAQKFANIKLDEQCFFSIETNDRTLDLIAPNIETKKVWVKTINLLALIVKNRLREGSSGGLYDNGLIGEREYEAVAKQFAGNLGNLHSEVEEIKQLCFSNEKKLKRNFLDMAEEALMKEVEQSHKLNKAVRILDKELQDVKEDAQNAKNENISARRHLEVAHVREKQLVAQLRSYNDEKRSIVDFIRQFQKKLLNCVEFLGLLDFEVHEKNGEQLVSTNNVAEGAVLNEDFANLDVFMNQMQVQFDTIMLKTNNMQKKFIDLQEKLKRNAKVHEATQKDRETWANKYNEIYALYNEAVMEKEKLTSDVNTYSGQLNYNVKENIKMKKEISVLENQLNEIKKAHVAKDSELKDMIDYARKLQGNMESQFEELRNEAEKNEMNKLNLLEDRYNMQIRRYENKISENDKMINELSELVKNYESQMDELVEEIDKKQVFIDDLTASRDKLNQMIGEMEDNLKRNKDMKTPTRRSTAHTSNREDVSALESPADTQDEPNLLNTQQRIDIVVNEREAIHKQHFAEMEANLKQHVDEIKRLEEENKLYNAKAAKVREHEDELKQKITRYQYKMKGIMEEGAKVRKHFKQLELYMSHWLNLIYLENVIMCVDETDSFSFTVFSKEVNHNILSRAVDRVKQAFHGVSTHSEFLKDVLRHVETSIPNITFDIKAIELARAYRHKVRAKPMQPRKRSTDLCFVGSYHGSAKSSGIGMISPFRSDSANRKPEDTQQPLKVVRESSEEREPLRQIQSPFSKRVDDALNRETKQVNEPFIRKAGVHKGVEKDKENRENRENRENIGNVRPQSVGASKDKVASS